MLFGILLSQRIFSSKILYRSILDNRQLLTLYTFFCTKSIGEKIDYVIAKTNDTSEPDCKLLNTFPQVILSYPFVNKAAVLPIPHSTMGNVCRAYVVPEAQHEINVNQLRDYAANNLISYKVPRDIRICPSLPVTPLGKINKALLIKKISDEYAK